MDVARPDWPELGFEPPAGRSLCSRPLGTLVFDRRLWHSRSDNLSDITRKAVFTGYTYRWIRPRDAYPIDPM